jgi:integrase
MYLNQRSKKSRPTMLLALRRALAVAQGVDVSQVTPEDLYRYAWAHELKAPELAALKAALEDAYSKSTAALTITAVTGVMRQCFQADLIPAQDWLKLQEVERPKPSRDREAGRYVEPEEIARLKEVCNADPTAAGVRDLAVIAVMWYSGPRVSEVVGFALKDYNPATGRLLVREGKGDKDRYLELHNGAKAALDRWLAARGDWSGPLFTAVGPHEKKPIKRQEHLTKHAVNKMLRKRIKQAGIRKFTPHDLRRTMITDMIAKKDLRTAQLIAGHADPSTTARYDRGRIDRALEAAAVRHF